MSFSVNELAEALEKHVARVNRRGDIILREYTRVHNFIFLKNHLEDIYMREYTINIILRHEVAKKS